MTRNIINSDLFCKSYKNNDRKILYYKGFKLASVKQLIEYCFPTYLLKVEHNHAKLQFDIYLSRYVDNVHIDLIEVNTFRKFFGVGFNVIIVTKEELEENSYI